MPRKSPRKSWPDWPHIWVEGRSRTPAELLKEILHAAGSDRVRGPAIERSVLACLGSVQDPPLSDTARAKFVREAHAAALEGRWDLADQLLFPVHSVQEEDPVEWPNYDIPVPASLILNEIVFRASVAAPPNLSGIIAAALRCAANSHAGGKPPHVQPQPNATPPVAGTPELDRRIVNALNRAIVATSDADWIYVENELNHD
jgi:hypothetical protein